MKLRFLMIILAVQLIAADPDPVKQDLDKFQGKWQVVKLEANGTTVPQEAIAKAGFVFEGNKVITKEGDKTVSEGYLRIDPSKKPAELEISPEKLPVRGKTAKGIYRFEDDGLKLALSSVGGERPTDFTAPKGSDNLVFTLKREKR